MHGRATSAWYSRTNQHERSAVYLASKRTRSSPVDGLRSGAFVLSLRIMRKAVSCEWEGFRDY